MTDRPLLMSGPMVRAIIGYAKTETRRMNVDRFRAWNPGDRVWVKETWKAMEAPDGQDGYVLRADGRFVSIAPATEAIDYWLRWSKKPGWQPAIFMPRAAARETLTLTDIRIERLQDIDEVGAVKEGMMTVTLSDMLGLTSKSKLVHALQFFDHPTNAWWTGSKPFAGWFIQQMWSALSARDRFRVIIDAINGIGTWDSNPEVAVISWRKV